eukprot:scaffold1326_cov51-Cyclotella_meneghiniana.AAC.6
MDRPMASLEERDATMVRFRSGCGGDRGCDLCARGDGRREQTRTKPTTHSLSLSQLNKRGSWALAEHYS